MTGPLRRDDDRCGSFIRHPHTGIELAAGLVSGADHGVFRKAVFAAFGVVEKHTVAAAA